MPLEAYYRLLSDDVKVECGSCHLCCRKSYVPVHPLYDDVSAYETQVVDGVSYLKHKPNGDCIYLGENGCTIHGKHPATCRKYSCAAHYKSLTKAQQKEAIRVGLTSEAILREGRKRLALERKV